MREGDRLLTTNELAEKFSVSPMTIFRLREKGLPYIKVGGSIRFEESKVKDWMEQRSENNASIQVE